MYRRRDFTKVLQKNKLTVRVVLLITPGPYLDISNIISSISISLISNMAELILSRGKVQFLKRRSMYRNSGVDQWKWEIGGREGGGGGGGGTGLLQLLHLPSCWNLLHVTSRALELTCYSSRVTAHVLNFTRLI